MAVEELGFSPYITGGGELEFEITRAPEEIRLSVAVLVNASNPKVIQASEAGTVTFRARNGWVEYQVESVLHDLHDGPRWLLFRKITDRLS